MLRMLFYHRNRSDQTSTQNNRILLVHAKAADLLNRFSWFYSM